MGSELHILRCLAILLAATYHMPVAYTNLWQTKNVPKYFESPPPNSRGARSSISENSRILDKWITEYVLFCDHFFCLVQPLGFIPVVHLGFSFLLYGCTVTVYPSTCWWALGLFLMWGQYEYVAYEYPLIGLWEHTFSLLSSKEWDHGVVLKYVFNYIRNCQILFQGGLIILYFH